MKKKQYYSPEVDTLEIKMKSIIAASPEDPNPPIPD